MSSLLNMKYINPVFSRLFIVSLYISGYVRVLVLYGTYSILSKSSWWYCIKQTEKQNISWKLLCTQVFKWIAGTEIEHFDRVVFLIEYHHGTLYAYISASWSFPHDASSALIVRFSKFKTINCRLLKQCFFTSPFFQCHSMYKLVCPKAYCTWYNTKQYWKHWKEKQGNSTYINIYFGTLSYGSEGSI